MNELRIVLVTELLRKLRSRIFWLATLGGVVVIAVLVELPLFFSALVHTSSNDIVIAGPAAIRTEAAEALARQHDFRVVAQLATLPPHVTPDFLEKHRNAGAAVALSIVGARLHVDVYPRDLSAFDDVQFRSLVPLAIGIALGLPPRNVENAGAIVRAVHPLDAKFKDTRAATVAHGVAFGLILMLYLAIILGSQTVMASVAEEKTSRIAEILIATIEPAMLLYGKTISAALVAFVQVGLWMITAALLVPHTLQTIAGAPPAAIAFDPGVIAAFLAFFVFGYLQYAAIYAAAASLVSRTEELGMVTTPVIMPVVGAFFVAQYALVEPSSPIVVACSFVPFLSPFVGFARIAITSVPNWQLALIMLVNIVTVAACFWAAGKVYRIGMLLYGKAPSLRQVFDVMTSP